MWTQVVSSIHRSQCCSSYFLNYLKREAKKQSCSLIENVQTARRHLCHLSTGIKEPFCIAAHPVSRFSSLITRSHLKRVSNVQNLIKNGQTNSSHFFHSSPVRSIPIPPLLWIVLKPVSKLAALVTGRGLRKWWQSLPANKKQYFVEATKRNRWKFSGIVLLTSGITLVYYYSHLEETPYTNRKRFIVFTPEKFKEVADLEFTLQFETHKSYLLPVDHPSFQRVVNVANQILHANKDIKELHDKKWTIVVIDRDIQNAFVLPNGNIFVFTGMINLCDNNDQLGTILSHEMAHCILLHAAENLSYSQFMDMILIVLVTAIWAVMPSDFTAFIADWFFNKIVQILIHLPYSRKLEKEADEVGLMLAAKACFDVRESSAFWAKVGILQSDDVPELEWLSTHPTNDTRVDHLNSIMDKTLELRKSCGCPALTRQDPRLSIGLFRKAVQEIMKQEGVTKIRG